MTKTIITRTLEDKNLRLFADLQFSLLNFGFYKTGDYCEGDETHTFFFLRGTLYTIEVIQNKEIVTSIISF